jgi:hypothetical protein
VGVGPEQNFTYIAALKPSMAFIVDIRRGNFDLHDVQGALRARPIGPSSSRASSAARVRPG